MRRFRSRGRSHTRLLAFALIGGAGAYGLPPQIDALTTSQGAAEAIASSRITVIDGDTFKVGSVRYRLIGMDACDMGQPITRAGDVVEDCGLTARVFLRRQIANASSWHCLSSGEDRLGRTLARCIGDHSAGSSADLGEVMVRNGHALAVAYGPHRAMVRYEIAELMARFGQRGMFSGKVATPADWRKRHR